MKLLLSLLLFALLPTFNIYAQAANAGTKHFENAGLAFDFPAGWKLSDTSIDALKHLVVSPERGPQQIVVIAQDAFDSSCNLQAVNRKITDALVERTASQIHAGKPLQGAPVMTKVGETEVEGVQLHGLINNSLVTGEVYSLRRGLRVVSLVYLRVDNDSRSESAWQIIRRSLTISPSAVTVVGASSAESDRRISDAPVNANATVNSPAPITGGVLNGRAIHLVQPAYPPIARQAHASGTVAVQVLIDESGDVIAAHATSGHPLLQAVAVAAARASKFSPTKLCGEPVRVAGIIQYNFVAQ